MNGQLYGVRVKMSVFPDIITIKVVEEDSMNPLSNIAVAIELFASRKNDYYFVLPSTDLKGTIQITKEWLKREIEKDISLFVMDYAARLEDCAFGIRLSVLDQDSVNRTIEARKSFKKVMGTPQEDIDELIRADNARYNRFQKSLSYPANRI
ncbi:hypothetical protein ABFB09_02185 [Dehalogenimonas sp. THU2]|uniref:hypothetical protein n=1 Tax=Dehalogenimonas sp. THU2 TaxID=3151121 RepID=UPI0032187818